jgi:hypothetical protein
MSSSNVYHFYKLFFHCTSLYNPQEANEKVLFLGEFSFMLSAMVARIISEGV